MGNVFKELKNYQKAVKCYEDEIKLQPNNVGALYNLGLVFYLQADYKKALNYYKEGIKLDPNNPNIYKNLGNIFLELGEFDEAKKCYEKAIENEPENLEHHYSLSNLKKEVLDKKLENKIKKILKSDKLKNNLAYGNFLLSKYEKSKRNYKNELKYLLKGHKYYFESRKAFFETQNKKLLENYKENKYIVQK